MSKLWYVGYGVVSKKLEAFSVAGHPTEATHGHLYFYVIGPFVTRCGAQFMAQYGQGNPHCQTVMQAERLAIRSN